MIELLELIASTDTDDIPIGNFSTKEKALIAAKETQKGKNPVVSLSGNVNFIFNKELIL